MCGCSSGRFHVEELILDPGSLADRAIELYDKDQDQKLSETELAESPALQSVRRSWDKDKDGHLNRDEMMTRFQAHTETGSLPMTVFCKVTRGGAILQGAQVKFIPDPLYDGQLPAAAGTTDKTGEATLEIENAPEGMPVGARLGIYRVEITTPDGTIPARHNSQTIHGQEVSKNSAAAQSVLSYEVAQ